MTADDQRHTRPQHERHTSAPADLNDLNDLADVADGVWQAPMGQRRAGASDAAGATLRRLWLLGETTRAVGAALSLTASDLAMSEAFDRMERETPISLEQAAELSPDGVRRWFEVLGDDLALDLSLEGLDPSMESVSTELRAANDPLGALADFQEAALAVAATQGDSVNVRVRLSVGKRQAQRLAEQALADRREAQVGGASAPEAALVFFSAAACERMLTLLAAPRWGQRGLGTDEQRLCVIICDATGYLAGPALEIIGALTAPAVGAWLPVSRAALRRFAERAAAARRLRSAESAWSGFALAWTPEHLWVTPRAPGLERIASRLQALRAQVAACGLASHVERAEGAESQGDLTLRFAGARPAVARLATAATPAELETQPRDALIELAGWAYRDASPDKLAIARQALADTLTAGASLSLAQLCVAAAPALDTARANFAIYLRGATERYFQLRASAQQTVSGFADATRAAVASLTSDVTDNLFRTVGLIVGVAIAWLLQPSESLLLVRIATALYTGYVLFIVWYLLQARRARYDLERQGLDDTLAAMTELTPAERERLRKPAAAAEAHFAHYYQITRVIYFVMAGIGALFFLLLLTPAAQALTPHALTPTPTR